MALAYGLALVTAPAVEPITLLEAKKHVELPLDHSSRHDDTLNILISAARERAETETGRQIITATWDLYMDAFPCGVIYMPRPPLQSTSLAISYVDTDGATQTWSSANYTISTNREPGMIRLAYNAVFPSIRYQPDAVKVRFQCGYGSSPTSVPHGLRQAMLLMIGSWFEQRSETVIGTIVNTLPGGVKELLDTYRVGDEFLQYGRLAYA